MEKLPSVPRPGVMTAPLIGTAATASKGSPTSWTASKAAGRNGTCSKLRATLRCHSSTSSSWAVTGSGSSSTALTALKATVLAPMPRASVVIPTALRAGWRRMRRQASRSSWARPSRARDTSAQPPHAVPGRQGIRTRRYGSGSQRSRGPRSIDRGPLTSARVQPPRAACPVSAQPVSGCGLIRPGRGVDTRRAPTGSGSGATGGEAAGRSGLGDSIVRPGTSDAPSSTVSSSCRT